MRGRRSGIGRLADAITGLALVAAVGLLVRDRVLPHLRDRAIADPGDRIPADLRVVDLSRGDTVALRNLGGMTLLAVLSTCPACERSAPAWREALGRATGPLGVLLVGDPAEEAAWVARELPGAVALAPVDGGELLRRLRIRVVPTALAISPEGVLLTRREGPVEPDEAAVLLSSPRGPPISAGR